jgi:hypothetical protein
MGLKTAKENSFGLTEKTMRVNGKMVKNMEVVYGKLKIINSLISGNGDKGLLKGLAC